MKYRIFLLLLIFSVTAIGYGQVLMDYHLQGSEPGFPQKVALMDLAAAQAAPPDRHGRSRCTADR